MVHKKVNHREAIIPKKRNCMTPFPRKCNKVFRTKGKDGLMTFDHLVRKGITKELDEENVVEIEKKVDEFDALFENKDDHMRDLIRARVILVISRMFEKKAPSERVQAMGFVDEEIPSFWEARNRYEELNQ